MLQASDGPSADLVGSLAPPPAPPAPSAALWRPRRPLAPRPRPCVGAAEHVVGAALAGGALLLLPAGGRAAGHGNGCGATGDRPAAGRPLRDTETFREYGSRDEPLCTWNCTGITLSQADTSTAPFHARTARGRTDAWYRPPRPTPRWPPHTGTSPTALPDLSGQPT